MTLFNCRRALTLIMTLTSGLAFAATPPSAETARQRLLDDTRGTVVTSVHPTTARLRLARFGEHRPALHGESPEDRAGDFLRRYGAAFGLDGGRLELTASRVDRLGRQRLVFAQHHSGVEVLGASLRLHFDPAGELTAVNGVLVPEQPDLVTVPGLPAVAAARIARIAVAAHHHVEPTTLEVGEAALWIYNRGLVRGRADRNRLVWSLEVGDGAWIRERLLVDAGSGLVVERIELAHDLRRRIHDQRYPNPIWNEGDPTPFSGLGQPADGEIDNLLRFSAETFDLFANLSGGAFLSWDGNDGIMHSVWNDEDMRCPNAMSSGGVTRYCPGTTTDDIIAHEWVHAYTERTHGLVYLWQPGALNESYSDIFGEIVDQLNGVGNDVPATVRTPGVCTAFSTASPPQLTVLEPAAIAGLLTVGGAEFNPLPPFEVEGLVELVDDGVGNPHDGCEELVDFTPGAVALMEFARCFFRQPAENAQAAGAAGVIVGNTVSDAVVEMFGDGGRLEIPSVFIARTDYDALGEHLEDGVRALYTSTNEASWRWLIGEDSSAFGGAIRDMWEPTCHNDPARVGDDHYHCTADDNGGVHSNSGVPNHAFALLVDGGEFNATTVSAIGLTKAAHVYWRAMSVYQTLVTDFAEHADLLEMACADLVGQPLTDLVNGNTSVEVIAASDCAQVAAAMAAVEMRREPSQCGFRPLLAQSPPALGEVQVVFSESFDADPGWTTANEGSSPSWPGLDWTWTADAPESTTGGAMAAAFNRGLVGCGGAVLHLDSPLVELPWGTRPTLVFDHWVGTAPALEGGNLKIAVNGGPFVSLEATDFLYNGYSGVLDPEYTSNPLAGEAAYTGFDGGELSGTWGRTLVDLSRFAETGDSVQIRFDAGAAFACTTVGWGWFIDNLEILMAPPVRRGGDRIGP